MVMVALVAPSMNMETAGPPMPLGLE
jgi:hypothetical protein